MYYVVLCGIRAICTQQQQLILKEKHEVANVYLIILFLKNRSIRVKLKRTYQTLSFKLDAAPRKRRVCDLGTSVGRVHNALAAVPIVRSATCSCAPSCDVCLSVLAD